MPLLDHCRPLLLLLPVFALGACDSLEPDDDEGGAQVAEVSNQECVSGKKWVGGDEESPLMHPGGDCMGCHESRGEGPTYLVAGTVYELMAEPDECYGVDAVTVEIVDADGREWSLPTNDAGNFWLSEGDGPIALPYRAAVVSNGMRLEMATAQAQGNCASCHTAAGAQGAPGRVVAP